jgi:threonine/homoserine/homoserine lactone efflux protein
MKRPCLLRFRQSERRTELHGEPGRSGRHIAKVLRRRFQPRVALLLLAFFPQFVRPERGSAATQVLILGAIFVCFGLAADALNS